MSLPPSADRRLFRFRRGRRRHEIHQGCVGIAQFPGPGQRIDGIEVVTDRLDGRQVFGIELDTGARHDRRPVVVSHAGIEDFAAGLAFLAAHVDHHGGHEFGFHLLQQVRGQDVLGQSRCGNGGNGVAFDVVFPALQLQRVHQPHQAQFGGRVVGLAEVAVHAGGRGGHDDAAVALFLS